MRRRARQRLQLRGGAPGRGIFSGGNSPTTGIYIDETPIAVRQNLAAGFSGSPRPDIFDLDRIEVLRGPQGTLFGSSAMGGVIRFITPQPNLESASGYAKAEFGYTDRGDPSYAVGVAYGAPIVEGVAGFRVSGWFRSDGGFIDIENPYTGEILNRNANHDLSYTLRPAFTFAPTDSLTITPAVFIQHQHSENPDEYWRSDLPNPEQGAHASGYGFRSPGQPATDDLTTRAKQAPSTIVFYLGNALPALALAQRVYQDPARAGELVARNDAPHPLFMPATVQALTV